MTNREIELLRRDLPRNEIANFNQVVYDAALAWDNVTYAQIIKVCLVSAELFMIAHCGLEKLGRAAYTTRSS